MGPLRKYNFNVGCGLGDLACILESDVVRSGGISRSSRASTYTS